MLDFNNLQPHQRVIVALDVPGAAPALEIVQELGEHVGLFKIGLQCALSMFADVFSPAVREEDALAKMRVGRELIAAIKGRLMLDLKPHDIEQTLRLAVQAIRGLEPVFFTTHASASSEALRAVVAEQGESRVLGVTVLTDIKEECASIFGAEPGAKVLEFAQKLAILGVDGVVCSGEEAESLRNVQDLAGLKIVVPAVRPAWGLSKDDQKRAVTPAKALRGGGADFLVIGRPLTQPHTHNPDITSRLEAVRLTVQEIEEALAA